MRIRGAANRITAWAANQMKDPPPAGVLELLEGLKPGYTIIHEYPYSNQTLGDDDAQAGTASRGSLAATSQLNVGVAPTCGSAFSRARSPLAGEIPAIRLSDALQQLDPERFPTKTAAKKRIRKGLIVVNGRKSTLETTVRPGADRISIQARTDSPFQPDGAPPFPIDVVLDDPVFAVVHKPRGVRAPARRCTAASVVAICSERGSP
jgi:hypothetical protein